MSSKLTYALLNKELVNISDPRVKNGYQCNCFCPNPECKKPLNARNNEKNIREKHFAHRPGDECLHAVESALHLLAKQVLMREKKLYLPAFHYDYNASHQYSWFKAGELVVFETVVLEKTIIIDKLKIDAIGTVKGKEIYIEFAKTHFVDKEKKRKLRQHGMPCIEISLKDIELDASSISEFLKTPSYQIYWLLHPEFEKLYNEQRIENEKRNNSIQKEEKTDYFTRSTYPLRNRIIEKEEKKYYPPNAPYKKFKLFMDRTHQCPIVQEKFSSCFSSEELSSKIIKGLIDKNWSGSIYEVKEERYIYVNNEKTLLQPSASELYKYSEKKIENFNKRYQLVKKFLAILENTLKINCQNCQHCIGIEDNISKCIFPLSTHSTH